MDDKPRRYNFAVDIPNKVEDSTKVVFFYEAIFHVSSCVYHHNPQIKGCENPYFVQEEKCDTLKIYHPIFFAERAVTSYIDMLHDICGIQYHKSNIDNPIFTTNKIVSIYFLNISWAFYWPRWTNFLDTSILWYYIIQFFLPLRLVKDMIYGTKLCSINDLKRRIKAVIQEIMSDFMYTLLIINHV